LEDLIDMAAPPAWPGRRLVAGVDAALADEAAAEQHGVDVQAWVDQALLHN
jgi:hypothetical protein